MKKVILVTAIALTYVFTGFAQEKFIFNNKGLTPFVVVEIPNVNQKTLYEKAINWLKESYKNPEEVIKAKIEHEKIRFTGFQENVLMMKIFGKRYEDVRYTIELSFKDGKYRFVPTSLENYEEPTTATVGGWRDFSLTSGGYLYKKSGKIKSTFKYYPENIETLFNHLNKSLKEYLLKKNNLKKDADDNW